MQSLIVAALLGIAAAQSNGFGANSTSTVSIKPSTTSIATSQVAGSNSAITVAADGSGQFTAINAAVIAAQNSGIPTVTVLPGTYSEAVTVTGAATVTIVGATATPAADWSQNQVRFHSRQLR
jgi:hypothetical protein